MWPKRSCCMWVVTELEQKLRVRWDLYDLLVAAFSAVWLQSRGRLTHDQNNSVPKRNLEGRHARKKQWNLWGKEIVIKTFLVWGVRGTAFFNVNLYKSLLLQQLAMSYGLHGSECSESKCWEWNAIPMAEWLPEHWPEEKHVSYNWGSTRNMEPWIECAVNPKNHKSHFTFSAFGIQLCHHSSPWKLKAWESFLQWTFHHGLSWGCVWSPTPLMSRMVTTRPGWWFCMELVDVQ